MKKFTKTLSDDIEVMKDDLEEASLKDKLEGEWEIDEVLGVSLENPKTNESLVINAEIGQRDIKRGEYIYITALLRRKGSSPIHQSQMGVIKTRVTDIYNSLLVLNSI